MYNGKVTRSQHIKDVIHIKVKKYAGYFNPESRSFAVDPHLTSFEDLQKILVQAFSLNGPFHITYLCRDDAGENVFLSMLTDWDLDAAFMTSSDPHLRLKLDAEPYKDGLMSKMKEWDSPEPPNVHGSNIKLIKTILQPVTNVTSSMNNMIFHSVQKSWVDSLGGAISKLAVGWTSNSNQDIQQDFFPAKPPLDDAEFRSFLGQNGKLLKPEGLRLRVYNGGVSPALRKVVWRLLLNIFPGHLTGQERIAYIKKKTDEYERLRSKWQAKVDNNTVEQISNMVWKDVLRTDRSHPFYQGPDDNPNTVALMNILTTFALTHPDVSYCQDVESLQEGRILPVENTNNVNTSRLTELAGRYIWTLGVSAKDLFTKGMSDLVSPIFMVMGNEAQAYVCFCGLMIRLRDNFSSHGKAMSIKFKHLAMLVKHYDREFFNYLHSLGADNMFFCYRWILLEMKREFSFDDAITVLEVMWSSLPPQPPAFDLPLEEFSQLITPSQESHHKSSFNKKKMKPEREESVDSTNEETSSPAKPSSSTSCSSFEILDSADLYLPLHNPSVVNSEKYETSAAGIEEKDRKPDADDIFKECGFSLDGIDFHNTNSHNVSRDSSPLHSVDHAENAPLTSPLPSKLPPPEELGCGNPFLLFVCLAVLLHERDKLISEKMEYDDMVMHFDKMVRKHSPTKVLSRAMKIFAEYLKADIAASSSWS